MEDSFNTAYLTSRQERNRAAASSFADKWEREEAQAQEQAAAPAAPAAPAKKESSPSIMSEGLKAVGGGAVDALRNAVNMVDDAATWLDNNFLDLRIGSSTFGQFGGRAAAPAAAGAAPLHKEGLQVPELPQWAQNQTTAGKVGRTVTQFLVPFLGATKALKAAGVANMAVRGAAAGATTDFAAFDPHEKRLSNLIMEWTKGDPAVGRTLFEYLQASPNDNRAEGRFKNTLEGLGLGIAVEGIFVGAKAVRSYFRAKNPTQSAAESVTRAAEEASKEAATAAAAKKQAQGTVNAATRPAEMPLQTQIDLLTGANHAQERGAVLSTKEMGEQAARRSDAEAAFRANPEDTADNILQRQGATEMRMAGEAPTGGIDFTPAVKQADPADTLRLVEEAAIKNPEKVHHAFLDDGVIVFSQKAPTPKALNIGDLIQPALAKAPHERTAEDLISLRAYRQMQEAAFPGIIKPGDDVVERIPRNIEVVENVGLGRPAITHKLRKQIREGTADVAPATGKSPPRATTKATGEAPAAATAETKATTAEAAKETPADHIEIRVGDTIEYGGGRFAGEVERIAPNGKVVVRTPEGTIKVVTPDVADPFGVAISRNEEAISALRTIKGRKQAGFTTPAMLANMIAAQAGGVAGYMSAGDDASFAEKLSLAGMGALTGLGVKVGAGKVLTKAERAAIETPHPDVASLARKEVGNIAPQAPLAAGMRKPPVIQAAKVNELVEAAKAGGYKQLAEAVKKADFNFNHIDTGEEVTETINAFSKVFEKETSLAKHGEQSFGQMKEYAEEVGAGMKSLRELHQGTDNLGGRILAHRALLAASAEKVTGLSKRAMTGDADSILALRKHVALHATIQAQMKGVQTEVARALAQFRITATSVDLAINERNQLIEAMGGHAANIRFAQQLSDITSAKKLNAVVRKGALARTQDGLFEAWVNGLLSGPVTHAVNAVSNGLVAIGSAAERYAAAGVGQVLRTGKDGVQIGEANAHLFGMMEGLLDAVKITKEGLTAIRQSTGEAVRGNFDQAGRIIRENENEFGTMWQAAAKDAPVLDNAAYATKEANLQHNAITASAMGLDPKSLFGYIADGLGTLVRLPGRALTTSDELFKAIHYRGELKAQAYRNARAAGKEGDELAAEIARQIEDPTPVMRAQSINAAREGTFTSPLAGGMLNLQAFVQKTPGAKYIMPFIRTPANIMAYVGTRTPVLNLMAESVRAEFKAPGARRDMMIAKTAIGGMMYALGGYLASQGLIVGGGDKDQQAEKLGGELPYAVKFGDRFVQFNRLAPYGMFLGLAADVADISGHIDDTEVDGLAHAAVLALSRNLVSQSYLSGLVDLIEMISSRDAGGVQKYFNKQAGSVVPGWLNAINKENDPVMKEAWTMVDTIRSRLPGNSIPDHLNIFGEPMKFTGGLGPDIASPFRTTVASTQPAAMEIARLNLDLRHPPRSIGAADGNPGIDLTPKQYHRYMQLIGEQFKPAVTKLVESAAYNRLPEDESQNVYVDAKQKSIKLLYEQSKQAAMMNLLKEDKQLLQNLQINQRNAGNALLGKEILPFELPE